MKTAVYNLLPVNKKKGTTVVIFTCEVNKGVFFILPLTNSINVVMGNFILNKVGKKIDKSGNISTEQYVCIVFPAILRNTI